MTAGSITTYRPSTGDAKSFWYGNISAPQDAIASIISNHEFVMEGDRVSTVGKNVFVVEWALRGEDQHLVRPLAAEEYSRVALALEGDSFA